MLVTGADEAVFKAAWACSSRFARVHTRHYEKHVLIKFFPVAFRVRPTTRIAKQNDGGPAGTGKRELLRAHATEAHTR